VHFPLGSYVPRCLFEVAVATRFGISIKGTLPKEKFQGFYDAVLNRYADVEQALTSIDITNAQATVQSDKGFILGEIRSLKLDTGTGEDAFNQLLQGVFKNWLSTFQLSKARVQGLSSNFTRPFCCATGISSKTGAIEAAREAYLEVTNALNGQEPTVLIVNCTATHNIPRLVTALHDVSPAGCLVYGGSTCRGVMAGKEVYISPEVVSIFAIVDPDGYYALAGGEATDGNLTEQVKNATCISMAHLEQTKWRGAGPMQKPCLLLCTPSPGQEEPTLRGVQQAVGTECPVFGGTSADNTLTGEWRQICGREVHNNGYALLLMWPTVEAYIRLSSLHQLSGKSGTITIGDDVQAETGEKIPNPRLINTIDGRPAAEVYNDWTGGAIANELGANADAITAGGVRLAGNILAASTNFPLAQPAGNVKPPTQGDPNTDGGGWRLIHPAIARPDGSIDVFAEVDPAQPLSMMSAPTTQLVDSVPAVIASALKSSSFLPSRGSDLSGSSITSATTPPGGIKSKGGRVHSLPLDPEVLARRSAQLYGGLVIYCGGMMMRVAAKQRMHEVAHHVGTAFECGGSSSNGDQTRVPYVGTFTFGEQGPAATCGISSKAEATDAVTSFTEDSLVNVHGNLMFNCLFFGDRQSERRRASEQDDLVRCHPSESMATGTAETDTGIV
jgi:hypothetical protein